MNVWINRRNGVVHWSYFQSIEAAKFTGSLPVGVDRIVPAKNGNANRRAVRKAGASVPFSARRFVN
ncbi:MAG: hypothetical protein P4L44_06225 [Oryzomonas sp.]|uniref:hypothetical protein n=1 Tax=Oryzomonas sp. TaxID=2855186 RepID=UPI0028504888|nr:hypothetical protein [Oryzomonas sp.]MDR3579538.1 hypothetical protein [Oryzomonas sp.]